MATNQDTGLVDIQLNFEYDGSSLDDGIEAFMQNVIDYQMYFETMDWTKDELDHISKQLVETGKMFALNQGFGPGTYAPGANSTPWNTANRMPTGTLYHSIKAEVSDNNSISFYNDARNSRGQPYAAHMEYGFHDRKGNFVPARPFMRPAMYAVAEGSKGNFQSIMRGLLNDLWTSRGYRGVRSNENAYLKFGRKQGSRSMFWNKSSNFSYKLSQRSRLKELRGEKSRKQMSANRLTKSGRGYKGYRFSKNNRDFKKQMPSNQYRAMERYQQKRSSNKSSSKPKPNKKTERRAQTVTERREQSKSIDYIGGSSKTLNGMTREEFVSMYEGAGISREEANYMFDSRLRG